MQLTFDTLNELKTFIGELGYVKAGGHVAEAAPKPAKKKPAAAKKPVAAKPADPVAETPAAPVETPAVPEQEAPKADPPAAGPTVEEVTEKAGTILNATPDAIGQIKGWLTELGATGISALDEAGRATLMTKLEAM